MTPRVGSGVYYRADGGSTVQYGKTFQLPKSQSLRTVVRGPLLGEGSDALGVDEVRGDWDSYGSKGTDTISSVRKGWVFREYPSVTRSSCLDGLQEVDR